MLMLFGALVILCLATSTKETRTAARARVATWSHWLWIPTALILAALIFVP